MITWEKYEELIKKGYSLDIVFILEKLKEEEISLDSSKIANLYNTIVRKGLYSESTKKLTITGEELLSFYSSPEKEKIEKKKVLTEDDFDLFWEAFPRTDAFEYKGKKFSRTRTLRQDPEGCRTKLKSILNTGEYKIEDIVRALKYDVFTRKENSYKTGQNKLSYLQGSKTYLHQLSFDGLIEESKGFIEKETSTAKNVVDI